MIISQAMYMNTKHLLFAIIFAVCPLLNLLGQAFPDRHSTDIDDQWLSCNSSNNPNPIRGESHWIRYDFGDSYMLTSSRIWNFNTPERINSYDNMSWSLYPLMGKLEDGMQNIVIDLSTDGITWVEHGRFTIPKAPGSSFYEGVMGPNFNGKTARYVLITGQSNYGGLCYGLGEIRFTATVITTKTDDLLANSILEYYPNPFNEKASVDVYNFPQGTWRVNVSDITGRVLQSFPIEIAGDNERFEIDGSQLSSGLYLLTLSQANMRKTIKLNIIK